MQTLLEGKKWIPSNETDVMATWKKFGFTPPSQAKHPPQDVDDYDLIERQDWLDRGFR